MSFWRWVGIFGVVLSAGCGGSNVVNNKVLAQPTGEHIEVPDEVATYSTDARPDGVVGGPRAEQLATDIAAELAKRGNQATPDGSLGATASWILREVNDAHPLIQQQVEAESHRFGFAGAIVAMAGFSLDADNGGAWRNALAQLPPNVPVTRYGVSVSGTGRTAAVAFGAVEIGVAPFPRHLALNDSVTLKGDVGPRYKFAHVFLTKSDGTVEEKRMSTRSVDATYSFAAAGKYNLEVMGDGSTGPVIVFNVPIYVGVEEETLATSSGHVTSPAEGEARMLELLNQSRKVAGLGALLADDELREIALAHSKDMVDHNFFGHVSPTTGTTEDRERRSGVIVASFGENITLADSAESGDRKIKRGGGRSRARELAGCHG